MTTNATPVNPITLEIVRNALTMIAEQIAERMIRSGTSYIIKEMEDCSAALFDGKGRLLSESASIPIHLNCIGITLRTVLDHYFPLDTWKPGDVVITNDPYAGGESLSSHHTNDIIAFHPVFHDEKLVGFTALNVHHMDIGAMWMGTRGWGVEIWQEGLRIPPLKLIREGKRDESLMALILNNSRVPRILENDLMGEAAGIQTGAEEFRRLFETYGADTVLAAFDELIRQSELRTRAEIRAIANGVYRHEETILDDGAKGGPYRLCLAMTVADDEVTFDFTGSSPQTPGFVNAPFSATASASSPGIAGGTYEIDFGIRITNNQALAFDTLVIGGGISEFRPSLLPNGASVDDAADAAAQFSSSIAGPYQDGGVDEAGRPLHDRYVAEKACATQDPQQDVGPIFRNGNGNGNGVHCSVITPDATEVMLYILNFLPGDSIVLDYTSRLYVEVVRVPAPAGVWVMLLGLAAMIPLRLRADRRRPAVPRAA